ncbi:hypothetical protein CFE70_010634 [Pyrenophora teres f. teres 0-1]
MAAADASAVGLAVQITQLHHDGVSNDEIQGSLQNLCRAQGMDEPTTQARVQEAFHIWSTMSTALQRTSLSNVPTPQGNEDPAPAATNTTVNPNEQPPAWLATLLAAIQPTNTVNTAAKRRRQPDPDMFDGTRKQYQVFYQQLTAKVENDKNDFENDKMACDYAFARLKGTAATLTLPYMNQMRISGKWDFNQLLGFFDQILDENTKMMIFKKGLAYKLQDKLVGLKSKNLEEIQNRAIEIADQLYRMDLHTKGTKNRRREDRSPNKEHRSRHRSTSPVLEDRMEGVEYTGRSGKPRRLSSSEYDRLRREGRCFNCKRRGHVSATCAEDEDMSEKKGKNKKTAVLKVSSSKTTERRKSRKAQKEELNSDEESSGVDTPEEDSDSGKD